MDRSKKIRFDGYKHQIILNLYNLLSDIHNCKVSLFDCTETDLKKYVVDIVGLPLQTVHRALRKRVSESSTSLNSQVHSNSEGTVTRKKAGLLWL